ncbi:MAG: MBOAT family protein [Aphanocapsa sp. GSE-SYN-MK-11-07L]|jgi:D-alanyl-lipoteichoic acid acyltransferase DltB (MBOAT superfamily)|nr:MBOAT family protein [Aphanocapsa sp. GSE-SYN-MK-11-07L]
MLFNSTEFLFFFFIVYLLYWLISLRSQNRLLLVASYFFYGWWDVRFLYLIVLSTAIDFCCGAMIDRGYVSRLNRQIVSGSVVLAAFFFDTLRWDAIDWHLNPLQLSIEWNHFLPNTLAGWSIVIGSFAIIIAANLLYPLATQLPDKRRQKFFLITSIVVNLLILGVFKYFNFFIENAEKLFQTVGIQSDFVLLNLILPVGISFYTFKAISYAFDVYQGKLESCDRFWDFSLFWAYFPPLFAGPIDRASQLLPQLVNARKFSLEQSGQGIFLILFGLFKKVAIADGMAGSVSAVYDTTGAVSWLDIVLATFLYAIQIYCDFSGYSDTARGVSKLLGIELAFNFDLPYFSKNPSEFWRHWHISLSTWLRDYLYIPLGGSRHGEASTYRNLMTTMVLGGLWHGAAWNFILWGFYQGSLLCGYRALTVKANRGQPVKNTDSQRSPHQKRTNLFALLSQFSQSIVEVLKVFLFFGLTCYGWMLFRATSLTQIISFTNVLFTDFGNFAVSMPKPGLSVLLGIPILIGYELLEYLSRKPVLSYVNIPVRSAFYATLILILLMGGSNEPAQFIYSQF